MGAPLGNNNGGKSKAFHRRLTAACEREDYARVAKAAETVLDLAADGTEWAILLLRDTLDGKPKQQTEITGEDGGPVHITEIVIRSVKPQDPA